MLELDGVIERGVALELRVVIDGHACNGGHFQLAEDGIDMDVDEILAGVVIELALEALFDDVRRNMALAEAIHGNASLLQPDGRVDGGVDFVGFNGDGNLLFAGGKFFSSIFHRKLLQNSLWCERGDLNPHA